MRNIRNSPNGKSNTNGQVAQIPWTFRTMMRRPRRTTPNSPNNQLHWGPAGLPPTKSSPFAMPNKIGNLRFRMVLKMVMTIKTMGCTGKTRPKKSWIEITGMRMKT